MKRTRSDVDATSPAANKRSEGACGARQTRESLGGRSGPSVKNPTAPMENNEVGMPADTAGANTSAAAGNAAPTQHAAQTLHFDTLSWWS